MKSEDDAFSFVSNSTTNSKDYLAEWNMLQSPPKVPKRAIEPFDSPIIPIINQTAEMPGTKTLQDRSSSPTHSDDASVASQSLFKDLQRSINRDSWIYHQKGVNDSTNNLNLPYCLGTITKVVTSRGSISSLTSSQETMMSEIHMKESNKQGNVLLPGNFEVCNGERSKLASDTCKTKISCDSEHYFDTSQPLFSDSEGFSTGMDLVQDTGNQNKETQLSCLRLGDISEKGSESPRTLPMPKRTRRPLSSNTLHLDMLDVDDDGDEDYNNDDVKETEDRVLRKIERQQTTLKQHIFTKFEGRDLTKVEATAQKLVFMLKKLCGHLKNDKKNIETELKKFPNDTHGTILQKIEIEKLKKKKNYLHQLLIAQKDIQALILSKKRELDSQNVSSVQLLKNNFVDTETCARQKMFRSKVHEPVPLSHSNDSKTKNSYPECGAISTQQVSLQLKLSNVFQHEHQARNEKKTKPFVDKMPSGVESNDFTCVSGQSSFTVKDLVGNQLEPENDSVEDLEDGGSLGDFSCLDIDSQLFSSQEPQKQAQNFNCKEAIKENLSCKSINQTLEKNMLCYSLSPKISQGKVSGSFPGILKDLLPSKGKDKPETHSVSKESTVTQRGIKRSSQAIFEAGADSVMSSIETILRASDEGMQEAKNTLKAKMKKNMKENSNLVKRHVQGDLSHMVKSSDNVRKSCHDASNRIPLVQGKSGNGSLFLSPKHPKTDRHSPKGTPLTPVYANVHDQLDFCSPTSKTGVDKMFGCKISPSVMSTLSDSYSIKSHDMFQILKEKMLSQTLGQNLGQPIQVSDENPLSSSKTKKSSINISQNVESGKISTNSNDFACFDEMEALDKCQTPQNSVSLFAGLPAMPLRDTEDCVTMDGPVDKDAAVTNKIGDRKYPPLDVLCEQNLMQPGDSVLKVIVKNKVHIGSLLSNGMIKNKENLVFKTPCQWLSALDGGIVVKKARAYSEILYKNVSLMDVVKGQTPPAEFLGCGEANCKKDQVSNCKAVKNNNGNCYKVVSEQYLIDFLDRCSIHPLTERDLVPMHDLPDNFWQEDFSQVQLTQSFLDQIDYWV